MDVERKINICEGVPLTNTAGAANIFLNTGKNTKATKSSEGTVIHLKTEKPADLGVHINTTLSIASSKKIKLLFVVNFLLSVICMVISCSVAFYYWNEMMLMRRHLDSVREQLMIQPDSPEASALVSNHRRQWKGLEPRLPRLHSSNEAPTRRRYFVEDLGEDLLFLDSSKKSSDGEKIPVIHVPSPQRELQVAHFHGGIQEINLGTNMLIGPWVRDKEVSSTNSESMVELNENFVTIQEGGLYLVYAQVVYLTHAPNSFFVFARQPGRKGRHLSTCSSGDDSTLRPLDKSQISCSVQTVARLYKGDTVNLSQREQNRTLWLREGYTYLGFIKLSS